MRTALHYKNGDATGSAITDKVSNVVFGLNKDYPEIVDNYDGTLVDIEQDVPVHAYYINNGSNVDIYFLANDKIYSPVDSSELFYQMYALKTVDTSNFDVSRTENMYRMFSYCTALEEMDVSHFDVSKAVNMEHAFSHLEVLEELDVSNWRPSSAQTFRYMFGMNYKLTELDVSNWDTSNVENTDHMFRKCTSLTEVNLSGWDTGKLSTAEYMFSYNDNLQSVDTTGWDTQALTSTKSMFMNCYALRDVVGIEDWEMPENKSLYYMFQKCYGLTSLDLSGWNLKAVENTQGIFFHCEGLETVDVSGWDTSKSTTMYATFYWCKSLKEIKGLADWDVSSVTNMDQMFRNCHELTSLDIAGWRPGKCTTFSSMFSDGDSNTGYMKLKELDIGQWDMSSAQNINWMFYGCGQLTELDLSGWDTSNITTMHHTFADCMKMETYNFTGWDTSKVTTMDGFFNSNKALKSVDVSEFDTQNVVDFDQFFDGCTSLEEIIGLDKWDTSKGQTFSEFLLNTKVRVLDLSSFDMSSATYVVNMFHINYELTTIYAGDNWNLNPDQLSQTGGMINYSPKLVGGQGTTYSSSDAGYMRIDGGEEAPGYLTYKPAQ